MKDSSCSKPPRSKRRTTGNKQMRKEHQTTRRWYSSSWLTVSHSSTRKTKSHLQTQTTSNSDYTRSINSLYLEGGFLHSQWSEQQEMLLVSWSSHLVQPLCTSSLTIWTLTWPWPVAENYINQALIKAVNRWQYSNETGEKSSHSKSQQCHLCSRFPWEGGRARGFN